MMKLSARALQGKEIKGANEEIAFKRFLKTVSDGVDVTFCGRVFHSREAATG